MPESELGRILDSLSPTRIDGIYVFASVTDDVLRTLPAGELLGIFREPEGVSVVLPRDLAEQHRLSFDGAYAGITLGVYSSLDAVGLTAAVAAALGAQGIPANVIAACHHDHVFVPAARVDEALEILSALAGTPSHNKAKETWQ